MQIKKTTTTIFEQSDIIDERKKVYQETEENMAQNVAADPVVQYMTLAQLEKAVNRTRKNMEKAARDLNFIEAARLRDEWFTLQKLRDEKK